MPNNLINRPVNLFKRPKNTFWRSCLISLSAQIILPLYKSSLTKGTLTLTVYACVFYIVILFQRLYVCSRYQYNFLQNEINCLKRMQVHIWNSGTLLNVKVNYFVVITWCNEDTFVKCCWESGQSQIVTVHSWRSSPAKVFKSCSKNISNTCEQNLWSNR